MVAGVVYVVGVVVSLAHIYFNTLGTLSTLTQNALHFAGFGLLCALIVPGMRTRGAHTRAMMLAIDATVGLLVAAAAIFMMLSEDAIYARGVRMSPLEWAGGIVLIVAAIELTHDGLGHSRPYRPSPYLRYLVGRLALGCLSLRRPAAGDHPVSQHLR